MKVYFTAFEQADLPGIAPVMRALSERAGWEPVLIPGTDFKEQRGSLARAAGIPGIPMRVLEDELGAAERARARARGRALLGDALSWSDSSRGGAPFEARVLAASVGRRLFDRSYAADLFEAYAELEVALDAFARAERPEMVVLGEDTDYLRGRLAARVLGRHRIPIVCLAALYYNVFASYPLLGERRASLYLAANRFYADRLKRAGVADERIAVVGYPAFDALERDAERARASTFLFALQGLEWEREIAADLADVVGAAKRILAIRPHPELSAPPSWLAVLAASPRVKIVEPGVDPVLAIRNAECVIAQSSAMLYQAAVIGRPVIVPSNDAAPLAIHLPEADRPHVVARTKEDLRRAVEKVVGGEGRALRREEIAPFHPRATERVVDCLERFRAGLDAAASPGRR